MKKNILLSLLFLQFCFYSCTNNDQQQQEVTTSENDIDAARNFIESSLQGKYDQARLYMLKDSTNDQYFNAYERNFTRLDGEERRDYREATINIHEVKPISDSATVIIFSNSYKKDRDTLKVVKINNQWLVDFKYLFQHNADTIKATMNKMDSTNKPDPL